MAPAILLLVLFGLLVVVTPFLTIALFVREAKLRRRLNELAEENTRQHTILQRAVGELQSKLAAASAPTAPVAEKPTRDRKSTRLNSSHPSISYAVFCLKKKNHTKHTYSSVAR